MTHHTLAHPHRERTLAALLACTLAAAAHTDACAGEPAAGTDAQPAATLSSVYGGLGPFGLSVGYAHRNSGHWVSRIQLNSGGLERAKSHADFGDNRYEVGFRTGAGLSTFTDYYPSTSSGFHLTGGLVWSRMNPALTGQPDGQGNYRINHHVYSASQVGTLTGRLQYDPVNLYLGGGWESAPIEKQGWRFVSDVGLFSAIKRAKPTLTATGAAGNAALQSDLDAERSELRKRSLGLAIQLGAAYSF